MHEVLLDWLVKKSQSYRKTLELRAEIEFLVAEEHNSGFPSFISKNRNEIEYQSSIHPLNSYLISAKERTSYDWAKPAFQQLRESVRLFGDIPYHSLFSMIGIKGADIPYSIRCSSDIPSKNKLENLLERYVDSIKKTKQEIEILAKKLEKPQYSKKEVGRIINKYSLADEIEF